jgi:hypothetical protein
MKLKAFSAEHCSIANPGRYFATVRISVESYVTCTMQHWLGRYAMLDLILRFIADSYSLFDSIGRLDALFLELYEAKPLNF